MNVGINEYLVVNRGVRRNFVQKYRCHGELHQAMIWRAMFVGATGFFIIRRVCLHFVRRRSFDGHGHRFMARGTCRHRRFVLHRTCSTLRTGIVMLGLQHSDRMGAVSKWRAQECER